MKFRISKQFTFCASHQLYNLSEDHPCRRLHGHNYRVELVLQARQLVDGFILDYGALNPFNVMLQAEFDHQHLNDVLDTSEEWRGVNPTAENLCMIFLSWTRRFYPSWPVLGVRVSETEKTWAEAWHD